MAGLFDDLLPGAAPAAATGSGLFDDLLPKAPAPVAPPKEPGMLRSLADTGLSVARGAVQGAKMLTDVAGAGNQASETMAGGVKWLSENFSDYSKWEQLTSAQDMKAAELSGSTWEEVKAAARAFSKRPVDFLAEAAGTSLPTIAAAFLPGGQGALLGRVAMLGMGSAQGAGAVKGQIYDTVEEAWTKAGVTPQEAKERAEAAQSYFGSNSGQIALGAALGGLAGRTGLESAIAGKAAPKGMLAKVPGVARGALAEGIPEAAQGGQEQLAGNLALQNEGFAQPTWAGVAGNASLEGLAGGMVGAVTSPFAKELPAPAPSPAANAPGQPPASLSPEQTQGLLTHAEQRLAALERKAQGQKGQTVTGFDGKPVKMDDIQPAFLTPEEKREIDFLKTAGKDADKLAKGYPGLAQKLAPAPRPTPEQAAASVLAAGSVDEAIKAATDATSGKATGGGLDRLRGILPDEQRREVIGLMATANNPNSPPNVRRFAEQQIDAIIREYTDIPTADVLDEAEILPTPDATELTDEERAAYVNAPSSLDRLRLRKPIPAGEATDAIPSADAQEIEPIPAGDASEEIPAPDAYEVPPVGEATEVIPTGDAMEVPRIPTGKATEIEPETVQADDLLTGDQMPYGSKTAANVRARREGLGPANVIEIPGAGWVVRPQPKTLGPAPINAQPAGTRGTNAGDVVKAAPKPADSDAEENAFRTGDFKAMLRLRKERQAKERAAAGDLNDGGILKHQKDDRWVMVLPDVEGAGKWRIQRFDKRGFSGHMVFNSRDEAIEAALGEGFKVRDDAAMDAMQDTPEFQRGNFAADLIRRLNGNEITREEADRQLAEYDAPKKAPDDANPARTAGPRPADGGRGDGAAVLPVQQPADVAAGSAAPAGQGVAGGGAAGPGTGGRDEALTAVRTRFGSTVYVRESDLSGDRDRMRSFTSTGKPLGVIVRDNLDPTGEKRAADNAETADNPLFDTITAKNGVVFANEAAAARERSVRGLKDSYDIVPSGPGFVLRRRSKAAPPPAKQGPTSEGATDEGLQGQGQGRREEVAAGAQAEVPAPTLAERVKQRRAEKAAEAAPASEPGVSTAEQVATAQELLSEVPNGKHVSEEDRKAAEQALGIYSLNALADHELRRMLSVLEVNKANTAKVLAMSPRPRSINDIADALGALAGAAAKKAEYERAFKRAAGLAPTNEVVANALNVYTVGKLQLESIAKERGLYGVKWAERNVGQRWTTQSIKVRKAKDRVVEAVRAAPTATLADRIKQRRGEKAGPATAQRAIDAFNADDDKTAMDVVARLPLADLQEVGAAIGFRPQINENAKRYRERLAEVAPRLTKTAREKAQRQKALFDKLIDRAMAYDRAADHMANSLRLGNAVDSQANQTGYQPMGGKDTGGWMQIPEALDRYAADVASLRDDPDYAEVAPMVRDKRPRVFEHKAEKAAEPAPAAPAPAAPAPAPQPEVDAAPAAEPVAEAPALPNPWEISQDEFVSRVTFTKEGSSAFPWVAKWGDRILEAENEVFDHPDLGKTVVQGGRFSKTKREAEVVARGAHKRAVRRGVLNGNKATPEALAAYPDLLPAEAPAPVRDERTIELRKRASVLRSLRECLG